MLIGIAGDNHGVTRICAAGREYPGCSFGMMLRDRLHRPEGVLALGAYARGLEVPANVVAIANSVAVPGVSLLHLTSAQIMTLPDESIGEMASGCLLGVSAHSLAEARRAAKLGAAYVMVSPIFPTSSKPGHPGIGLDGLAAIASSVPIPVIALGGITGLDAARGALAAGARGIASVSLFSPDSRAALAEVVAHILAIASSTQFLADTR